MTDFEPILRDANRRLSDGIRAIDESPWSIDVRPRRLEVLDLTVTREMPPERVATALEASHALLRDRVYSVDGRRLCWARTWLPADLVAGSRIEQEDTGRGGTPAQLAELGYGAAEWVEEVAFVEAVDVAQEERQKLGIDDATSVARIVRYTTVADGRLVEVTDMRMIANAYRFRWAWANR